MFGNMNNIVKSKLFHELYLEYLQKNNPKPRIRVKAWNEEHVLFCGEWMKGSFILGSQWTVAQLDRLIKNPKPPVYL